MCSLEKKEKLCKITERGILQEELLTHLQKLQKKPEPVKKPKAVPPEIEVNGKKKGML